MPKNSKSKPGPKPGVNRSAFVRTMPNAKPAEIVKAAYAKGIKLTAGLVYAVRAAEKAKGNKVKATKSNGRKPGPKPKSAMSAGGVDQTIRRLALTHGLLAVEESLKKLRSEAGL